MQALEFNQMLLLNAEFLKPFAVTLTHDSEDAKDLFQETMFRALVNEDKYHLNTNIKAWLYTIMRNVFINNYRRKSKQNIVFDNTGSDFLINSSKAVAINDAISTLNIQEIKKAITDLPDIFKTPFMLHFNGYKYDEIAVTLSEPLGTIKSRIHFARRLLKAQIERF